MSDANPRQFGPEELAEVFRALERIASPCVLIGGQAVNYWARRFLAEEPALQKMEAVAPFLSKDVDFLGSRDATIQLAHAIGCQADLPGFRQSFGNLLSGKFTMTIGSGHLKVEVLRKVPGLSETETQRLATVEKVSQHSIRILNPVGMLLAKTWNVVNISEAGRHDAEQLLVLLPCVRAYLKMFLKLGASTPTSLRAALNLVEHALGFIEKKAGLQAAQRCGLDWRQILPHAYLAAATEPALARLRTRRLPLWLAKISGYQRGVPDNPTLVRLLDILACHAETPGGVSKKAGPGRA